MGNIDGIYAVKMTGAEGQGFGMFVFSDGVITGVDPLGVQFDGSYHQQADGEAIEVRVKVTAPPDGTVIQGQSTGPTGMSYEVSLSLAPDFMDRDYVAIETPLGPVNANFSRLRRLPGGEQ